MPRGRPPKNRTIQPENQTQSLIIPESPDPKLIVSVVKLENTWPSLAENFYRSAGYLAKALGFDTYREIQFEGIHCRAVAKSKSYNSLDRSFACRDSFAQLVRYVAECKYFKQNDWFLFCEDDLSVAPDCPILCNVPEQVKMLNLSWSNHAPDPKKGGTITYKPHPLYPGFAAAVGKDMFLGTALLIKGKEMLRKFAAEDFKKWVDWDLVIGNFMEANPVECALPIPAIAGQLVKDFSNHHKYQNYYAKTIPWGLGLKNPVFDIPRLSGFDFAEGDMSESFSICAEENLEFINSEEFSTFKSRYVFKHQHQDALVFSSRELNEQEIAFLCNPIHQNKASVVTGTLENSHHKSMQIGKDFRVVPFFQPFCFSIDIEMLMCAGLPDEEAFPYWGSDIEWSIRIRNTWSSRLNAKGIIAATPYVNIGDARPLYPKKDDIANPHKNMVDLLNKICPNWRTYASAGEVTENWKNW